MLSVYHFNLLNPHCIFFALFWVLVLVIKNKKTFKNKHIAIKKQAFLCDLFLNNQVEFRPDGALKEKEKVKSNPDGFLSPQPPEGG